MNQFSEDRLKEIKEAFDLYDISNDNLLNMEQAELVLKCLGYNIQENEMHEIFNEYSTEKNCSKINFNSFVSFITVKSKEDDIEAELMECFTYFDKDKDGKINNKEMKYLLLSLGEKLNDEEVDELIKIVDTSGEGSIGYKDFVKILLSK